MVLQSLQAISGEDDMTIPLDYKLFRYGPDGKCLDCGLMNGHGNTCHDCAPGRLIDKLREDLKASEAQNDKLAVGLQASTEDLNRLADALEKSRRETAAAETRYGRLKIQEKAALKERDIAVFHMGQIHEIVDHISCAHGFHACVVCEVKAVLANQSSSPEKGKP